MIALPKSPPAGQDLLRSPGWEISKGRAPSGGHRKTAGGSYILFCTGKSLSSLVAEKRWPQSPSTTLPFTRPYSLSVAGTSQRHKSMSFPIPSLWRAGAQSRDLVVLFLERPLQSSLPYCPRPKCQNLALSLLLALAKGSGSSASSPSRAPLPHLLLSSFFSKPVSWIWASPACLRLLATLWSPPGENCFIGTANLGLSFTWGLPQSG